jgi:hypothetical protein
MSAGAACGKAPQLNLRGAIKLGGHPDLPAARRWPPRAAATVVPSLAATLFLGCGVKRLINAQRMGWFQSSCPAG